METHSMQNEQIGKRHILVTGGAGFIGSHLVDALIARGHTVTVMDIAESHSGVTLNPHARFMRADVTKSDVIERVIALAPDVIYHFAGNANVARSVAEPIYDLNINYKATAYLLEAASQIGVRQFIFSSTGGGLSSEHTVIPTPEHAICKPLSPYAMHKLYSERLGEFYRVEKRVPFVALRFANVYGPRQSVTRGEANVIATFADAMTQGADTRVNGTGLQTRDYVYVDDVVDACLRLLDRPDVIGPLNVGSSREVDVLTIHQLMSTYLGYTKVPQMQPGDVGASHRSCLDTAKIQMELGWKPRTSLVQGLAKTIDWYAAQERTSAILATVVARGPVTQLEPVRG
jgi:UDP-glucose 4-epimerase